MTQSKAVCPAYLEDSGQLTFAASQTLHSAVERLLLSNGVDARGASSYFYLDRTSPLLRLCPSSFSLSVCVFSLRLFQSFHILGRLYFSTLEKVPVPISLHTFRRIRIMVGREGDSCPGYSWGPEIQEAAVFLRTRAREGSSNNLGADGS